MMINIFSRIASGHPLSQAAALLSPPAQTRVLIRTRWDEAVLPTGEIQPSPYTVIYADYPNEAEFALGEIIATRDDDNAIIYRRITRFDRMPDSGSLRIEVDMLDAVTEEEAAQAEMLLAA